MVERVGEALKPCPNPWCSSHRDEPDYHEQPYASRYGGRFLVSCPNCPLRGPFARTPVDAIAAWNTRPNTTDTGFREGVEAAAKVAANLGADMREEAKVADHDALRALHNSAAFAAEAIAAAIQVLTEPAKAPAGEAEA